MKKKPAAHTEAARTLAARRETHAGGRPRNEDVERCPCKKHTLARCLARGGSSDHEKTCTWYREPSQRAIII